MEPAHEKTYKMACAPSKDQPGHPPSLIRSKSSLCAQWVAKDPSFLHADSKDWSEWADPRLIWVFSGRTCHFVGFVMHWPIYFHLSPLPDPASLRTNTPNPAFNINGKSQITFQTTLIPNYFFQARDSNETFPIFSDCSINFPRITVCPFIFYQANIIDMMCNKAIW